MKRSEEADVLINNGRTNGRLKDASLVKTCCPIQQGKMNAKQPVATISPTYLIKISQSDI